MENLYKINVAIILLGICLCYIIYLVYREYYLPQQQFTCAVVDADTLSSNWTANATEVDVNGEKIFKTHCERCHNSSQKKLTGPGLAFVFDRIPKSNILVRGFIANSDSIYKQRLPYFNEMRKGYDNVGFKHNYHFSQAEWESLKQYLSESNVVAD